MTHFCRRCGEQFVVTSPMQRHCVRCAVEVASIIAADERRRRPRFTIGKDMSGALR